MKTTRIVKEIIEPQMVIEGAGVLLRRSIAPQASNLRDPFLLFDHFAFNNPNEGPLRGFPTHPHRGIETVTYMLEGSVSHRDSLGNQGLIGAGDVQWMNFAKPAAMVQALFVILSFAALTHAYIVSDFSVLNVASNSHSDKPMLYKISGVWGNHEGSMMLWVLILAIYGLAVAVFGRNLPPSLRARVLGIQALIALGFYLFILLESNNGHD